MKTGLRPVWIMALCTLLLACGNPSQRLDEFVFYDGPEFQLKVVRYYRNIPFSPLGEQAVVMCRSESTAGLTAPEPQDAGWRVLGSGDAQGSKNAADAAARLKQDYDVLDDRILAAKLKVFNISFDACGHFINWDPTRLPPDLIDPVKKPDSCAPVGQADCRYSDFEKERRPRYGNIRAAGTGQVSFSVSSPAFRNVESLRVQTGNNGALWHVEAVGLAGMNCRQAGQDEVRTRGSSPGDAGSPGCAGKRLASDSIRSLPMSRLAEGMDDTSLTDWLASVLPPGSMVIWPDAPAACGDGARGASGEPRQCAEIRFSDSEGGHGALFVTLDETGGTALQASFHSAVYSCAGRAAPFGSLAELQQCLTAGGR